MSTHKFLPIVCQCHCKHFIANIANITMHSQFSSQKARQYLTLITVRLVQRQTRHQPKKSPSMMNWPACTSSTQLP